MRVGRKKDPMVSYLEALFNAESSDQVERILQDHQDLLFTDRATEYIIQLITETYAKIRASPLAPRSWGRWTTDRLQQRLRALTNAQKYGISNARWSLLRVSKELVEVMKTVQHPSIHMPGIDGRWTDLSGIDLREADLRGADLKGAKLKGTLFDRANLSEADSSGADLSEASLRGSDLQNAKYSERTRWPSGFDPIGAGAIRVDSTQPGES